MTGVSTTVKALCRANLGVLRQKLQLMDVMTTRFGLREAGLRYSKVCPIVGASIGQHVRHSMDHLELAARLAATTETDLHYDLRHRGGEDENDMGAAEHRINAVVDVLQSIETSTGNTVPERQMNAYFMLSADPREFELPTTIERELGFCAHHAIHHMALVRVIALQTVGLKPGDLANDFGRAPSTLVFDNVNAS
jgi:hypothetical protein